MDNKTDHALNRDPSLSGEFDDDELPDCDTIACDAIACDDLTSVASGRRIALVGRFGGMNRRQAASVLRSYNATITDLTSDDIDWVVIGADESPLAERELLPASIHRAAADGFLEIIHETDLWQRLGLVDAEQSTRQFYTPAMLAHWLGVSVRVIRRWHRRGLIHAVRTLHHLPYFDFTEVATARRLAQWIAAGASPKAIEQHLVNLVEVLPDIRRPLDQLSILVEGKQILLRQGEGLVEPGGQLRFDFDLLDVESNQSESKGPTLLAMWDEDGDPITKRHDGAEEDDLLAAAYTAEDDEDFESAVEYCRAILARDGPRAEICFQIAELLYRMGEVQAARERYFMAIEIDPEYVEARASLGNVLAELDQPELAIATYRGALTLHEDYSDVHYNLARLLDLQDRSVESLYHWKRFLSLTPQSPWADEATSRIEEIEP
jgi:tetratricopeptide (TPR) repeat protein